MEITIRELIDKAKLQRIQDYFCNAVGLAAICLDEKMERVTAFSGDAQAESFLIGEAGKRQITEILERVEEGSLEDLALEEIPELGGRLLAAVAVRADELTLAYWVVLGRGTQDVEEFYRTLDLIRDLSIAAFFSKVSCFSAEVESKRSQIAEQEMERDLRALEAITRIVRLLDDDSQIEFVMDKWLTLTSEHLKMDAAQLFQLNDNGASMNVICEWCAPGKVSAFDRTTQISCFTYLKTDKPLVISGDNVDVRYREEMDSVDATAIMVFPIIKQSDDRSLVVSLNRNRAGCVWTTDEIKFAADAVKILQSILMRRVHSDSLKSSYASMEAILDNVGCGICAIDQVDKKVLFANKKMQYTFPEELREGNLATVLEQGQGAPKLNGACEFYHAEEECWYDVTTRMVTWVNGNKATLYSLYDITDKKSYQKKIEQQAYTDFLTGLYNRMCCERDLARQIDEAERNGEKGALLYMDLDDFKHINDGLGHQYGDVLLRSISNSLRRVRGIESTCYRMGGDEFVIIIPPKFFDEFEQILGDIQDIFCKPWFLKNADYYCTVSAGVVTFPDAGSTVAELIKKADVALFEAKKNGKNRITQYHEDIDTASGRRLDMEKNMRDATAEGCREFQVYYQPIVDIQEGKPVCAGAEALIRWNSEKLGFIAPSEFIPLAEYLGLINPMGSYVLSEACAHCKYWNDHGHPNYKVNVNLSVIQLLQPDIVESIKKVLEESGLNPRNLTLEVTESLAINDMERMKIILDGIKSLGVKLALDDFGTGYSSLNHIREIPFDVIKVDQSFVKDLAEDAYSQSFVKMVAELAETIGVSVCVEGIETMSQYKVLQGMKVKYIQGYYFDRPMPRDEFEKKYVEGLAQIEETM